MNTPKDNEFFKDSEFVITDYDNYNFKDTPKAIDISFEELINDKEYSRTTKNNKELQKNVLEYLETKNEIVLESIFLFCWKKIKTFAFNSNDDELCSDLQYVFFKAINAYDPNKKTKAGRSIMFNTYFTKCMKNYICVKKTFNNAQKRIPKHETLSLDFILKQQEDTDVTTMNAAKLDSMVDHNSFINIEFQDFLERKIYPGLKEIEVQLLSLYLKGYTLDMIGKQVGGLKAPNVHIKLKRIFKKPHIIRNAKELLGA